ncbi:MAG: hypothetical protein GX640_16245 [Fibrobacter sp.]|nr:hypothetical protein [Fibrobacter sp.]
MGNQKTEWKMIQVDGDLVEKTLTDLTNDDWDIFTVQYTGSTWSIIARKFNKEKSGKNSIGFGPRA